MAKEIKMSTPPRYLLFPSVFAAASALEFVRLSRFVGTVQSPVARRSASRLLITTSGAILWPGLVLCFCQRSENRLAYIGGVLVLLYLLEETRIIGNFYGRVQDFETMDRFDHRAATIGTFLFTTGMLLKNDVLGSKAKDVTPMIFTSLGLCCLSAIMFSSEKRTVSPEYAAVQKMMLSYSAGFLCLAVIQCL